MGLVFTWVVRGGFIFCFSGTFFNICHFGVGVLVGLFSFMGLQNKNAVYGRGPISTRVTIIELVTRVATMNGVFHTIFVHYRGHLVGPVPGRTTLRTKVFVPGVNMFLN